MEPVEGGLRTLSVLGVLRVLRVLGVLGVGNALSGTRG